MVTITMLKSNPDNESKCPVAIQANHNYKTKRKTLFRINPIYWDGRQVRKSHPDQVPLNRVIRETLNDFEQRYLDLERSGVEFDVSDLFVEKRKSDTLVNAINAYAEDANSRSNNELVAGKYRNLGRWVSDFDDRVQIEVVGISWMKKFRTWLENQDTISSTGTVNRYIGALKTVLRNELIEGRNIDPAVIHMKPKPHKVVKNRLTRDEFKTWCNADVEGRLMLFRDFFAAMVYLRGLRVGDVLQLQYSDVVDGRVLVKEQKTGKHQDIAIIPELQVIIDRYAGLSKWYLFPILKQIPSDPKVNMRYVKHIQSKTAVLNHNYKVIAGHAKIKKKVTNHIARHTFASFAERSGLDVGTVSKMLNHSSVKITELYLGELRRSDELDDAAKKVFGS